MAVVLAAGAPGAAAESGADQMVRAIVETCLPKVSRSQPLQAGDLVAQGNSRYFSADGAVSVLDAEGDFACQVFARADPEPVSSGLEGWTETSGYALIGTVPMTTRNLRGLYIYGQAEVGGFVQIHVTNLPDGLMGALLTRTDQNPDAERALRQ